MNHNDKGLSIKWLPLREGHIFSWRFLAVLSLVGCIAVEILFNILPIDHNTLLLYWFYPVSIMALTQLYFSLRFTKNREIRFLLAYLCWMCLCVILNHGRMHLEDSYPWFMCMCTVLFLCFSLPYAFDRETAARLMTALVVATVLAVALLSIVSLIALYAQGIAAKFPSVFEGISLHDGRLYIDSHPNRSAPAQALAVVLAGYLLAQSKKTWQRVLWILLAILCYIPLALTVSRTAIIGAGVAVGFEVYLVLQEALRKKTRVVLHVLLGVVAACISLVVIYKGAELVGRASNLYLARVESAQVQQEALAVTPTTEPAPATSIEEPASTAQPVDVGNTASAVADRGLVGADSFSGRTDIWLGVWNGLLQNPRILAFGTGPAAASDVMAPYFPVDSPIGLFHNSLLAALVSFGVVGLLLTLVFVALVVLSAVKLSFGARNAGVSLAMRLLPAVLIFTFAEGMMEDFLFAYQALNISWIWFMIAAGFVVRAIKNEPMTEQETKA